MVMNFYCGIQHEQSEIAELFTELSIEDQMIVFTDIQYGSVNQLFMKEAMRYRDKNIVILTGVNLPVILEITMAQGHLSKEELKQMIQKASQQMVLMDMDAYSSKNKEEDIF